MTTFGEIKERCEKATPGTWRSDAEIVERYNDEMEREQVAISMRNNDSEDAANAEFIANARQDVPMLLKALELAVEARWFGGTKVSDTLKNEILNDFLAAAKQEYDVSVKIFGHTFSVPVRATNIEHAKLNAIKHVRKHTEITAIVDKSAMKEKRNFKNRGAAVFPGNGETLLNAPECQHLHIVQTNGGAWHCGDCEIKISGQPGVRAFT